MLNFNDKVAIITGGNSGIGEAAAKLFAKQGAAVVLVARRADKLDAMAAEITAAGGRALAIPADVTDPATAARVCEETVKQFGKIDILVNSAGEGDYTRPITGVTDEFFDHIVKVDQYAVFYMCREVVKYMQSAHSGSIVNISSVGGVFHNSGFAYAALIVVGYLLLGSKLGLTAYLAAFAALTLLLAALLLRWLHKTGCRIFATL